MQRVCDSMSVCFTDPSVSFSRCGRLAPQSLRQSVCERHRVLAYRLFHGMLRHEQDFPASEGLGEWWKQPCLGQVKKTLAEQRMKIGKPAEIHPSEHDTYGLWRTDDGRASAQENGSDVRESPEGPGQASRQAQQKQSRPGGKGITSYVKLTLSSISLTSW